MCLNLVEKPTKVVTVAKLKLCATLWTSSDCGERGCGEDSRCVFGSTSKCHARSEVSLLPPRRTIIGLIPLTLWVRRQSLGGITILEDHEDVHESNVEPRKNHIWIHVSTRVAHPRKNASFVNIVHQCKYAWGTPILL